MSLPEPVAAPNPLTPDELLSGNYKYGFVTDIASDVIPKGLSEDVIRLISAKKNEPAFMLDYRLNAYRLWQTMTPPAWAELQHPPIDFQDIRYYAAPKTKADTPKKESLADVDPELLRTFEKLGIPLSEQKKLSGVTMAVDAVFDSVSVATTFKRDLAQAWRHFLFVFRSPARAPRFG